MQPGFAQAADEHATGAPAAPAGHEAHAAVARRLREQFSPDQIALLLSSESPENQRVAILALGQCGSAQHTRSLAGLLRHPDARVVRLAEDALWSIWLRAGTDTGNAELREAVREIRAERYDPAARRLAALITREPELAEAHHQRGLVAALLDQPEDAAQAYEAALRLNPLHFSALAGLGHLATERGDVTAALRYYRQALHIHPRLEGVDEAVRLIEAALAQDPAALPPH